MSKEAIEPSRGGTSAREIRSRQCKSRRVRRFARGVLAPVAVATVLALLGVGYEAVALRGDARTYPPPGRLVDMGGFRVHINCAGTGSPTVILDAGLGSSSLDWSLVQPALKTSTRVCAYDRAGMGWSDPSPQARTPANIAEELHTLLANANIAGPYVLVAHSLSGKSAQLFARRRMDEMAGMVLVDARSEYVDAFTRPAEDRAFIEAIAAQGRQYAVARRFGIARLLGTGLAGVPTIPPATRTQMALLSTQESAIAATIGEARARSASDIELRATPTLGALPLVVLVSDQSIAMVPNWAEAQRRLAALSSAGRLVIASGSSHAIQWDRPSLVIDAVREIIAGARSRQSH